MDLIILRQSNNIAHTGTTDIISAAQSIDELINTMDEQDLILVNEHLQHDHNHFRNHVLEANNANIINVETLRDWESIALFILGTCILYGISQHGTAIIDLLFNLQQKPNMVEQSIADIIHVVVQNGHIDDVRRVTIITVRELLNDPDTASSEVNAFRVVDRSI